MRVRAAAPPLGARGCFGRRQPSPRGTRAGRGAAPANRSSVCDSAWRRTMSLWPGPWRGALHVVGAAPFLSLTMPIRASQGRHSSLPALRQEHRGAACRAAMERAEPAMIDLWGATLDGPAAYRLAPGARRYEFYEKSFASIVRALPRALLPSHLRPALAQPDRTHTGMSAAHAAV